MSDEAVSDHSSDPDFQPSKALVNNLALLTDRKTRNQAKNHRRSKSVGKTETLGTSKNLLNQSNRLVGSAENILNTTSKLLDECESILDTTNPPSTTTDHLENMEHVNKPGPSGKKIDWNELEYNYYHQDKVMEDDRNQGNENQNNKVPDNTEDIQKMIEQKINEALQIRQVYPDYPKSTTASKDNLHITFQEAIRLLPESFDGKDTETLEIFLEKCEFAVKCVIPEAIPTLLQAIQTRLVGKARQVVKYRTFEKWDELRDILKSNLEPQRTTPYLYLELYAMKQRPGEEVLAYSMRIEQLQNLIIEQETADLQPDIAKAVERTINRQVIQVFMEGLGELKHFIKARNPENLDKAIQTAREEERIRTSNRGAKQYLKPENRPSRPNLQFSPTTGNCHHCGQKGHYAKNCLKKIQMSKPMKDQNQKPAVDVRTITCNYCKKLGHKIAECRKRLYVNSKKDAGSQAEPSTSSKNVENYKRPGNGGRPAGNLQAAIIQLEECLPAQQ